MQHDTNKTTFTDTEQLFLSFASQLQHSFLQLTRLAEHAATQDPSNHSEQWDTVQQISEASMILAENYALQARLHGRMQNPTIEPVAVSSLLYDIAHILDPFAKQYGVQLQLQESPKSVPVMTDREVLRAAMVSLGQVFVVAESQSADKPVVRLAAHRSRYGIVTGLYGNQSELNASALKRARLLHGAVAQPFSKFASGPVAGVFVAESLLGSVASKLHVARYQNLTGLAATLQSCNQLQLV